MARFHLRKGVEEMMAQAIWGNEVFGRDQIEQRLTSTGEKRNEDIDPISLVPRFARQILIGQDAKESELNQK